MPKRTQITTAHGEQTHCLPTFVTQDYPGSELERSLSSLAELTGNLRMQMFLRRIQAHWPEGVDTFNLGWATENDRVKAVVMADGEDSAGTLVFAEYIQGMFWHEDACFVNLVNQHFDDNNIDYSKDDLEELIRTVAGKEAVALHQADTLDGALPSGTPKTPSKPRM